MAKSYSFGKTIVITLGGSIVFPERIDIHFVANFKKFIERFLRRGVKFVIVIGGGRIARLYQDAAAKISPVTYEDKDWIGIHSTRLNAHLLRTVFRRVADPTIFDSHGKVERLHYPVTIASGWRPGWSTDFVAAAIAADLGIPEFIVAGKPSHVFHKDPGIHKDAKPFDVISWKNYRKLVPKKWIPGSHYPVDPVAARLADQDGIKAIVIDGRDLSNFEKLLKGKGFRGTIIS